MTKTKIIASSIFACGALALVAVVAIQTASAAPNEPPAGGVPTARILMVDMNRVFAESQVGHDIQRQVEALRAQATKDLDAEGKSLQSQHEQLQQQAAILAADVKQRRLRDFEQKREAFQEKIQKRSAMIQNGFLKAQTDVNQALVPVLQGIMNERGATILVDRRAVLLAAGGFDATTTAVHRLDIRLKTVKVELVAPADTPDGQPKK